MARVEPISSYLSHWGPRREEKIFNTEPPLGSRLLFSRGNKLNRGNKAIRGFPNSDSRRNETHSAQLNRSRLSIISCLWHSFFPGPRPWLHENALHTCGFVKGNRRDLQPCYPLLVICSRCVEPDGNRLKVLLLSKQTIHQSQQRAWFSGRVRDCLQARSFPIFTTVTSSKFPFRFSDGMGARQS